MTPAPVAAGALVELASQGAGTARPPLPGHAHEWSFHGRAPRHGPRPPGLVCDEPTILLCRDPACAATMLVECGTSRASQCAPCGAKYRARVGVVAGSGLRRHVGVEGLFITVTCPGAAAHRMPSGHLCPCTPPGGVDVARWNADLGRRWNRLVQDLRRLMSADVQYFKAVEPQRRGALHVHALIRSDDGPTVLGKGALRRLAIKHGFGHSVDVQRVQPGHAAYVAKYAAKSADARPDVPWRGEKWVGGTWVRRDTGELCDRPRRRVPSYSCTARAWSGSRRWGELMRDVRAAQAHFAAVLAGMPSWEGRPASDTWRDLPVPLRPDGPPPPSTQR